jgi:hypothetical protein
LINFVIKNHSWSYLEKNKKHKSRDHCKDFMPLHSVYQKKWKNISGIYKITYLPNRLFTYYGSSKNIGQRIKYHFYNGAKYKIFWVVL